MSGFTKLFSSIVTSTIWREPAHVRLVWITMLAISDREGVVEGSVPGLADVARVTLDECVDALNRLRSPDPWSRTQEHEGRRIEDIRGGWKLLNHRYYRDLRGQQDGDLSMTPEAIRQRRHRARRSVTSVTSRDSSVTPSASASGSSEVGVGGAGEGESGEPPLVLVREDDPVWDYCTRLAVAANKGLNQVDPRILASRASTRQAAEILFNADIPLDFAEKAVFEKASRTKNPAEVRSLSYFVRAVVEEWEKVALRAAVAKSPLAAGKTGQPMAVCPDCGERVTAVNWSAHWSIAQHRSDIPPFANHMVKEGTHASTP